MNTTAASSTSKRKRTDNDNEDHRRAAKRERRIKQKANKTKGSEKEATEVASALARTLIIAEAPVAVKTPISIPGGAENVTDTAKNPTEDNTAEAEEKKAIYKERRKARAQRKRAATTGLESRISLPEETMKADRTKSSSTNVATKEQQTPQVAMTTTTDVLVPATQYYEPAPGVDESRAFKPEYKRERTAKRRQQRTEAEDGEAGQSVARRSRKEKKQLGNWAVSDPIGGRFVDTDPVFTPDEK